MGTLAENVGLRSSESWSRSHLNPSFYRGGKSFEEEKGRSRVTEQVSGLAGPRPGRPQVHCPRPTGRSQVPAARTLPSTPVLLLKTDHGGRIHASVGRIP